MQVFSYLQFMSVLLDKNYIRVCGFRLFCIMITNNYSISLGLLVSFEKKKSWNKWIITALRFFIYSIMWQWRSSTCYLKTERNFGSERLRSSLLANTDIYTIRIPRSKNVNAHTTSSITFPRQFKNKILYYLL